MGDAPPTYGFADGGAGLFSACRRRAYCPQTAREPKPGRARVAHTQSEGAAERQNLPQDTETGRGIAVTRRRNMDKALCYRPIFWRRLFEGPFTFETGWG